MPKKYLDKIPWILLILIFGGCTYKLFPGLREDKISCPSHIMRIDYDSAESAIATVYSGPAISRDNVTRLAAYDGIYLMPLGYDSNSDSWVFSRFSDGAPEKEHIVVYRKGKRTPVTLEDFPSATDLSQANHLEQLRQAALLDSDVYIPFFLNGNWVVYRYDLAGKLIQKKVMHVPGVSFMGEERIAVARNGYVVANLGSGLCVMNENGGAVTTIPGGSEEKISPDGRMIAYRDRDYTKVVIMDLHTMDRRAVTIWPQPNARLWDMLINPSHFQMDWENQWLLFAYETNFSGPWQIYGADVSSPKVRWKRLPIVVQWWDWVVINKAPKS